MTSEPVEEDVIEPGRMATEKVVPDILDGAGFLERIGQISSFLDSDPNAVRALIIRLLAVYPEWKDLSGDQREDKINKTLSFLTSPALHNQFVSYIFS